MNDVTTVEISKSTEDLTCHVSKLILLRDVFPFERTTVHVFQQNLNFSVVIVHLVTLDHVWIINISQDLDFSMDLTTNRFLVMTVNHLQSVSTAVDSVNYFINRSSATASDPENLQLSRWRLEVEVESASSHFFLANTKKKLITK
ncbi:hypothetical protein KIW84_076837 [Lathyrus oleraceus]|uniref:Uncharacterized protein n=1 Tax=Pisum sativum TaxID=3888 RepID=A0A9D5A2W0_PEA|nr:hypothetical protein KIW84_076837 [Pisum sativum]